ncbi:hypothetical protein EV191_12837 [Tamaricihabitans halophyticus]|uniref:Uncharacterized protein n=2 Tax=Tamaricihabitans halophyticus TaxID=1262583 RepID=A0A4R2PXK7_9PSEU|nr:hypothetical protein EV191_12837 [Tamaricihabitans halophyticus]
MDVVAVDEDPGEPDAGRDRPIRVVFEENLLVLGPASSGKCASVSRVRIPYVGASAAVELIRGIHNDATRGR